MTRKDKINRMAKAANHIRAAIEALKDIDGQYQYDAQYYVNELQSLLTCDNDEAGLDAMIRQISQEA